jgi:hypothetical protein
MANRYQNLLNKPTTLPGVNRYADLSTTTPQKNRYSDLMPKTTSEGAFKKTIKSFGGTIGAAGRFLTAGQTATSGLIEKGLESIGVLRPQTKGLGITQGFKEQKSNIETLKRIGKETSFGGTTLGGALTGSYTPTTSVFGNFVYELPVTALGTVADIFLDPLMFLGKVGKIAEGTKIVGTAIKTGAKSLAKEIPAVQKVGDMLGRAFLTRYGQSGAFKNLDIARKIEESLATEKVGKLVSDIIEKPSAIQQRITQIIKGEVPEVSKVTKGKTLEEFVNKKIEIPNQLKRIQDFRSDLETGKFTQYAWGGDRKLGEVTVHKGSGGFTIRNIFLPEGERGKGIGTQIYEALNSQSIKETNNPLMSTKPRVLNNGTKVFELSNDAKNLWEGLVKKGKAIKNSDGTYQFISKSQLIDIWNKENKAIEEIPKLDLKDSELKILAEPIRQELDRVGESISKLNPKLLSEETFQANKGTYFPRLYTDYEFPATDEGIIQHAFGSRAVSVPKEPFKKRILTEAESLAKGTRIEEAGYPAAKRLLQLNITEARQKFFKGVSKLASNEPKPGWLQLSEDKALGDLAGKFLPAAEYKAVAEIRKIPGAVEQIYNKALATWKTFKTAYNPSTIARNDLTNYFLLNPLGGVGPHRLDIYAKTANELISKGPLYQMARKEGLEISTQQAAELMGQASKFYKENKNLVSQFFGKVDNFHNAVKDFYGSQDKFFKLANFIKGVTEDGLTPQKALQRANFYLVDYSEVPEFIAWLRKSPIGIPFVSFTYGVSKPLAKTLLERPDKLGAYFKILSGIQQMNPTGETPQERQAELDVTPDWIQQGTTLRLPVKDKYGRGQYIDLQYILPFNILESKSITPSSPLLNMLASMLTNKDTFTGKDITMQTDTDAEKAGKWATYLIRQIVPSLAPFGYSWEKVKALLQNRPDANGYVRKTLPVLMDVLGGIKITPIDQTIEGQKRAHEKQKQLEELRSNLFRIQADKTLLPETKSEESIKIQKKIDKLFAPK